jgi:predicted Zn-ribbon and HTH transcriptional regulator
MIKNQRVDCNICGHRFYSKAQINTIKCPNCKSNKSLSIRELPKFRSKNDNKNKA